MAMTDEEIKNRADVIKSMMDANKELTDSLNKINKREYTYEDLINCPIGTKITLNSEYDEVIIKTLPNSKGRISFVDINGGQTDYKIGLFRDKYRGKNGISNWIKKIEEPIYVTVFTGEEVSNEL